MLLGHTGDRLKILLGNVFIAGLWHEIMELCNVFTSFAISFVKREGNKAAHVCAKLASVTNWECVWCENFPRMLLREVENDCNPATE
jgi:hypothetical protein